VEALGQGNRISFHHQVKVKTRAGFGFGGLVIAHQQSQQQITHKAAHQVKRITLLLGQRPRLAQQFHQFAGNGPFKLPGQVRPGHFFRAGQFPQVD
jgi:hypothetical protein